MEDAESEIEKRRTVMDISNEKKIKKKVGNDRIEARNRQIDIEIDRRIERLRDRERERERERDRKTDRDRHRKIKRVWKRNNPKKGKVE